MSFPTLKGLFVSTLKAEYGDHTITLRLGQLNMGSERFDADERTYQRSLRARQNMPAHLRQLLMRLFERQAITSCKITYGNRIDLKLPRTADGRTLMSGKALQRFQRIFSEISGRKVVADWGASAPAPGRRSRRESSDYSGLLGNLAVVFDAVCDGIVLGAAVDQLTSD